MLFQLCELSPHLIDVSKQLSSQSSHAASMEYSAHREAGAWPGQGSAWGPIEETSPSALSGEWPLVWSLVSVVCILG